MILDVEELYAGCIHVEAAKELCKKFKDLYGVEDDSDEIIDTGWFIQIYHLSHLWKSYKDCSEHEKGLLLVFLFSSFFCTSLWENYFF